MWFQPGKDPQSARGGPSRRGMSPRQSTRHPTAFFERPYLLVFSSVSSITSGVLSNDSKYASTSAARVWWLNMFEPRPSPQYPRMERSTLSRSGRPSYRFPNSRTMPPKYLAYRGSSGSTRQPLPGSGSSYVPTIFRYQSGTSSLASPEAP